jgi:hypothetical protein
VIVPGTLVRPGARHHHGVGGYDRARGFAVSYFTGCYVGERTGKHPSMNFAAALMPRRS